LKKWLVVINNQFFSSNIYTFIGACRGIEILNPPFPKFKTLEKLPVA